MTLPEAFDKWAREVIYKGNVKPGVIFPTEGSHYAAFKAGWDAAENEQKKLQIITGRWSAK
jgi:hypothetical protein